MYYYILYYGICFVIPPTFTWCQSINWVNLSTKRFGWRNAYSCDVNSLAYIEPEKRNAGLTYINAKRGPVEITLGLLLSWANPEQSLKEWALKPNRGVYSVSHKPECIQTEMQAKQSNQLLSFVNQTTLKSSSQMGQSLSQSLSQPCSKSCSICLRKKLFHVFMYALMKGGVSIFP